jgi:carbonic anhydrase
MSPLPSSQIGRRKFLAAGAGIALSAPMLAGLPRVAVATRSDEAWPATPDEALQRLMDGNRRFVEGRTTAPNRNLARVKETAPKQAPFAAFLGCADSRVPIEIVFDQGFGDVFVTRVAGNIADSSIIASLEFGTAVLGSQVLMVLGHSSCGAVAAAVKGDAVPGQISTLYQHIIPASRSAKGDLAMATRENVRLQALILAEGSPVISGLIREGKLKVVGGVYDLATGVVTPVPLG